MACVVASMAQTTRFGYSVNVLSGSIATSHVEINENSIPDVFLCPDCD